MGKVVILGGNARSGKSTLAYELQKQGYHRISFDLLNTYLNNGLSINFDELSEEKKFQYFESVVNESINEANHEDINVVIDMYDYLPADIHKLENKDQVEVYFLAYPSQSREEIKYNVIHYAKPTDWIAQVNEKYLEQCVDRFYDRNQMLVEECKKYNQTLIDTKGKEERLPVLKELFKRITEQ